MGGGGHGSFAQQIFGEMKVLTGDDWLFTKLSPGGSGDDRQFFEGQFVMLLWAKAGSRNLKMAVVIFLSQHQKKTTRRDTKTPPPRVSDF